MKKLVLISLLLIISFVTGCKSNKPQTQGSIGVGNGMRGTITYVSPHKYQLEYHRGLHFSADQDHKNVEIDNSDLVLMSSEVSSIHIRVLKKGVDHQVPFTNDDFGSTISQLKRYVETREQTKKFSITRLGGATGLYNETRTQNQIDARYYLVTPERDIIVATIHAVSIANGLDWVAPIIQTFSCDVTPPTIAHLQIQDKLLRAGEWNTLLFEATDDNSGIADKIETCGYFKKNGDPDWVKIYVCGQIERIYGDWYQTRFLIDSYKGEGYWSLVSFSISDRAGNSTSLILQDENYWDGSKRLEIPLIGFNLINPNPGDTTPPVIDSITNSPDWKAGRAVDFMIKANDTQSGILYYVPACGYFTKSGSQGTPATISLCGEWLADGKDTYRMAMLLNRWLPPGDYFLTQLSVSDNADNVTTLSVGIDKNGMPAGSFYSTGNRTTSLPIHWIHVDNPSEVDSVPPVLHAVRTTEEKVRRGMQTKLFLQITDDKSGVFSYSSRCFTFYPVRPIARNATLTACGYIKKETDNWYSITLEVDRYRPAGEYYLGDVAIFDEAGNSLSLTGGIGSPNRFYRDMNTGDEVNIPVLRILVTD